MTYLISILIALPFLIGLVLLFTRSDVWRRIIVVSGVVAVIAGSIAMALPNLSPSVARLPLPPENVSNAILALEAAITLYLLWVTVKARLWLVGLMALAQAVLLKLAHEKHVTETQYLFVDQFSVIMALIPARVEASRSSVIVAFLSARDGQLVRAGLVHQAPAANPDTLFRGKPVHVPFQGSEESSDPGRDIIENVIHPGRAPPDTLTFVPVSQHRIHGIGRSKDRSPGNAKQAEEKKR